MNTIQKYVKTAVEIGLKTDCQGIYVNTTDARIEALQSTGFLEFGVGDTRTDGNSTIANRQLSLSSSKNPAWQQHLLDTIPSPGYRDYALHREIRESIAAQLKDPNSGKRSELFRIVVEQYLIDEFVKTKDFEPIRVWVAEKIRKCAAKLNPNHEKQAVNLRNIQSYVIKKILAALRKNGMSTNFVCELAARIGKTILFLELARSMREEFGHEAMFIMAYGVGLSVKTSYQDECGKFSNFSSLQFIDASESTANVEYNSAIKSGKMPVVFVSLNPDAEEKYEWINQLTGTYIALLEETDFGTHTDTQVEKVEYILKNKTATRINASGTNIGRLAKAFGKNAIDEIISVPYCLVEQDTSINNVVVRRFYNMVFSSQINKLLEDFDQDLLPNITKILSKPLSQQRFISALFQDLFGYQPIYGFNLSDQVGEEILNSMLFVNITKQAMDQLAEIIEKACPEHKVLILNGDYTDNKEAESLTKEELVRIQNNFYNGRDKLLVITNMMGTRSYSIPEIQACLFMQEGGDVYPYMQKYSRCLTPGFNKKFGHIFDFAFDQSKTRNTVMSVAVEATLLAREQGISYPDAVRTVMNSVNIKDVVSGHWVSSDDIIKQFEDNNKLLEIANANTYISLEDLTTEEIEAFGELAKGSTSKKSERTEIEQIVNTGPTYTTDPQTTSSSQKKNPLKALIEKAIRKINGGATTVVALTDYQGETFLECLDIISNSVELRNEFVELYNIGPETIVRLSNRLPIATLDMIIYNSKYSNTQKHIENSGLAVLKDPPELWKKYLNSRSMRRYITSNACQKILNVSGGHGTEVDVLVELYGLEITKKIVYNDKYNFLCNQIKRKYPDITVIKGDFIKLEFNMKFDLVVGNPPYKGQAQLHQKFFNKAVDLTKDDGVVLFLQPSTVYFNKKEETQTHSELVRTNIKKYKTSVEFVNPKVFENANVYNELAITHLIKTPGKDELETVTYSSGKEYENVRLEDITKTELAPTIYASIVTKYKNYVSQHGSIIDVTTHDKKVKKANITSQRGNIGGDDWYTFMPAPKKFWVNHGNFGVVATDDAMVENIYDYFTLNAARFGLAIYKFAGDMHGGAMGGVPLVPFTKKYTDDEIYNMIGLTQEERDTINNFLPDYYGRYKSDN
jgi:hypothetical protein